MGLLNYFKPTTPPRKVSVVLPSAGAGISNAGAASSTRSSFLIPAANSRFPDEIKYEVILNHLFQRQCSSLWVNDISGAVEGSIVRRSKNDYMCCPPALKDSQFLRSMCALNVQSAMTVRSRVISTFLTYSPRALDIPIRDGLRIQIVTSIESLARARKLQYAAFVASESLLVVWDDEPSNLIKRVESIEADLLKLVWLQLRPDEELAAMSEKEKEGFTVTSNEVGIDEETGLFVTGPRPILYHQAVMVGFSLCLMMVLLGLGYQRIAQEVTLLHRYLSLLLLIMTPINFFLALFFTSVIISIVMQILGPVRQLKTNSKFYSASPPPRIQGGSLPHITIQCPVYKEGLEAVIKPTVRSIRRAISTYELQGGTANLLIHDDGLQIINEEEKQARIDFYSDNDIGWTARPKHGSDGFIRRGKFKKASNMNYGLALSNAVEERLLKFERSGEWTQDDESTLYQDTLQEVLKEDGRAWAAGNIRIGDYILIIDSDTRVPADCLLDAASEMEQSPEVAILQFSSGVMQVSYDFFENGITFFTNMIYTAIRFGVSSGDVAPFVGHNAILRWSAVQECAFIDDLGQERWWSETSVSEDFDIALRLQVNGYIVRLAAWAGDGFKEGVSLTIYDELTRWEKYAYGCSELVMWPIKDWWRHGPITPLFRRFVCSDMPLASKLSIISYIGTYYAIGGAWITTLVNYVVIGLYNGYLDKWYTESYKIWLSIIVVFTLAGNVALAVQRYRIGEMSLVPSLFENFKWCLMFVIMFGGMSVHVSQALLSHLFSIDMQWGATAKEVKKTNFFIEVPQVARKFKYSMSFFTVIIIVMVIMARAEFIPWSWNITQFTAIFPMAMCCASHILLPIALNPGLMTFTW